MNPQVSNPTSHQANPTISRKRRSLYPSSFPEPTLLYDDLSQPSKKSNLSTSLSNIRIWGLTGLFVFALLFSAYSWMDLHSSPSSSLNHLFQQTQQAQAPDSEFFSFPAVGTSEVSTHSEPSELMSPKPEPTELTQFTMGRSNPFDPIQQELPDTDEPETAEEDLMPADDADLLEYIGIISGNSPNDSVAIIHLLGTGEDSTKLVELGDTFSIDEKPVRVQQITDRELHMVIDGTQKIIPLKEYVDALEPETEDGEEPETRNPSTQSQFRPNVTPQFSRSNR